MKKPRMFLMIAVFMVSVSLLAAGCGKSDVVATVNGEQISRKQMTDMVKNIKEQYKSMGMNIDETTDKEIMDMLNSMALDQVIIQTVLLQEANKLGIEVGKADVDKEIATYKETMTEEKFKQFLAANGLSEIKFAEMLEKGMIIDKLQDKVLSDVKPATESQARDYFEKNKDGFAVPASYQVRHILVMAGDQEGDKVKADLEARTKILAVLEQLKNGGNFAEVAKQKSEDYGSAPQGGLYTFSPGEAVPEFESAAIALKPGEMTMEPVKTMYGYHLIKMEKATAETQKTFAQVREEIMERLSEQAKSDRFNEFIENAKKQSEIVNNLEKSSPQAEPNKN